MRLLPCFFQYGRLVGTAVSAEASSSGQALESRQIVGKAHLRKLILQNFFEEILLIGNLLFRPSHKSADGENKYPGRQFCPGVRRNHQHCVCCDSGKIRTVKEETFLADSPRKDSIQEIDCVFEVVDRCEENLVYRGDCLNLQTHPGNDTHGTLGQLKKPVEIKTGPDGWRLSM